MHHEPTVFCSFAHLRDLWWHYCSGWWCSPVYVGCRWWKKELDYVLSWLVGNIIIIIHHFHWNWAALILSDQLDYLASSKSGFTFSAGARILVLLVYVLSQKRTFEIKSTSWTDTKKNSKIFLSLYWQFFLNFCNFSLSLKIEIGVLPCQPRCPTLLTSFVLDIVISNCLPWHFQTLVPSAKLI